MRMWSNLSAQHKFEDVQLGLFELSSPDLAPNEIVQHLFDRRTLALFINLELWLYRVNTLRFTHNKFVDYPSSYDVLLSFINQSEKQMLTQPAAV